MLSGPRANARLVTPRSVLMNMLMFCFSLVVVYDIVLNDVVVNLSYDCDDSSTSSFFGGRAAPLSLLGHPLDDFYLRRGEMAARGICRYNLASASGAGSTSSA